MSAASKSEAIKNRLKRSQENEDNEIMLTTEKIKNITTGMDIFQLELDKLKAAPNEWNFYTPLNDNKMSELIESIIDNGLLNPIIVWEQDNDYMILSGHNRVKAYSMIYEQTGNEKYKKIYTYIKKKNEITEDEARTIIIDTNFVQRQLSTAEKTKSIVIKYNQLGRKKRNSGGETTAGIIAKQYNLKERQIYNYYKLNNLIPEFMERIDNGTLSIKCGLKLAAIDTTLQKNIYDNYNDVIDNNKVKNLNINADIEEIIAQLKNSTNEFVNITVKIPVHLQDEFKTYIDSWIKAHELGN
ncbi:chromosome partitioning protein ParB [Clostridium chromiireducens]|uniref:Chromosome partitioning protein ParB n=1 Tax=Clostridium chromiireducens TaxID=225345 RepID=A0A964RSD9_9CLOT|nr:ParB N-terminal domain-containing protein [Clostridium chromiireducens]MVX66956.1 chromosome partitioning protein ParB [Clostridium chromiireducens]